MSIALLVATVYLFMQIPKGFLPTEDQNRITVNTEANQGISFEEMVRHQMEVAKILAADPNIAQFGNNVGVGGPGGGGSGVQHRAASSSC